MSDLIKRADAIDAIDDAIDADSPQFAILRTKIGFLPSADAVHIETYRELYEKYVELKHASAEATIGDYPNDLISRSALMEYCSNQKSKSIDNNDIARFPSAEAVPHGRLIDADALYKKATDLWDKSDSEDFEKGIFKLILNAVSAQTVQCGKENEFIQILKSWETNKVDAISKRFISDAILQKISELNAQGEKAIPIAREFIRFKRFVDGLTPIRTDAVQGWIPCSERLPDVGGDVLTTTDWSDVLIAWLNKDGAWETEEHILNNDEILAWMPLPDPYKGD